MSEADRRKPEIRKDAVHNRWVILSPARARRPSDFKSKDSSNTSTNNNKTECPFCIGHEHDCAPEIFRVPSISNSEVSDQWKIRVIQNLYPALSRDIAHNSTYSSPSDGGGDVVVNGFGFHDVVIESPLHSVHLSDLEAAQVGDVFLAYKKRIHQIRAFGSIKYVQVFKNHGASAGASMSHSHSQIMALPVIPPSVSTRLDTMKEYFDRTGKCSICELQVDDFLVDESPYFISIVPFAATFPFEIWIIPRDHSSHFDEIDDRKAVDLGGLLKVMLQKMGMQLNNPPFNFVIHTSPLQVHPSQLPYMHWFLQIVPQLSGIGGFEMGTGCYINPVFPEDAAKLLREVGRVVNGSLS